jgi:hypothetical protein
MLTSEYGIGACVVLMALATVLLLWSFHGILLLKMTSRYFILFAKGMFRPFSCSL